MGGVIIVKLSIFIGIRLGMLHLLFHLLYGYGKASATGGVKFQL